MRSWKCSRPITRSDGQLDRLRLKFVERERKGYVYYNAELNERFDSFELANLRPSGMDYPLYRMEMRDGGYASYAIKDEEKYVIEEDGLVQLANEQLPVNGFWLRVCGSNEVFGQREYYNCEANADFFFDAIYGVQDES